MYVISRMIKIEKGYDQTIVERFNKPSPIFKFKGFIKREILLDKKNKAYDVLNISTYFEDKKAFYRWEGSPEHIQLHKDRKHIPNQKPEGVISVEAHYYELALLQTYSEEVS